MANDSNQKRKRATIRDWVELLLPYLWGRVHYKFCTVVFGGGIVLISAADIWEIALGIAFDRIFGPNEINTTLIAQLIGLFLCLLSITMFVLYYRADKKREKVDAELAFGRNASELIGVLRHLIEGFRDQTIQRPPAYFSDDIRVARDLAREVVKGAPNQLRQHRILASLRNAGIDASGVDPVYGISTADLEDLIVDLSQCAGGRV